MTKKSALKITLNLYTSHTQRPDPSNVRNLHNNCLESIKKTTCTNPVPIVFEFCQFSAYSLSTKKLEITYFKWLKHKATGPDFFCVFWSVELTFFLTVYGSELLFSSNSYSSLVTQQMLLSGMILLHVVTCCSAVFFNSLCFQHILRNMSLTFWKISVGLNFTSLTRNDEKSAFWPWKWGVDLYMSKYGIIWHQNVLRTKKLAHKAQPSVSLMFLHFVVFCDLLLCIVTQCGFCLFYLFCSLMIRKQNVVNGDIIICLSSNRS